ncbi:MAG: sugar kinase [Saprospiraceae bacterium]|nr:bifunctional hydroxymethylpyrimidine kinase/phosphomethylpyrimidine kinase [Bacteroidia bacterium]NNE14202.1 sugar kinase [Saprospiraceae bacterium]NNL91651.1 sugar kinase [Saprospiraceae bacterium]
MSLLTVGTVAFDDIETPFGKVEKVVGGACTYISWAASYFINDIRLTSIIGNDFPAEEIKALEARGVNMEGLKIMENGKTFFWAGKYHENMNQRDTITTDLNVLDDFDPELPESYKDSQYVMLGNLTPDIQLRVMEQLTNPKLIVLDTMNFWMDVALDKLKLAISKVDVLTINDEEARQLSGEYSLVNAAKKIFEMGPKYLVIKKGEHGAMLMSEDNIFYAPALPLAKVMDPTGAGDSFAGGFIGYLTKTEDTSFENMKRAVIYGSTMASFCVEEFSLGKMKHLSEHIINDRAQRFVNITNFTL